MRPSSRSMAEDGLEGRMNIVNLHQFGTAGTHLRHAKTGWQARIMTTFALVPMRLCGEGDGDRVVAGADGSDAPFACFAIQSEGVEQGAHAP